MWFVREREEIWLKELEGTKMRNTFRARLGGWEIISILNILIWGTAKSVVYMI